ncbi:MAG: hypothetical protein AB8F74_20195 [Saprospiraceae bacterium]
MKSKMLFVILLLGALSCGKETSLYEELREEDKLEAAYHFSPSTLRMLNFESDSSINTFVKDIRKLSFLSMKPAVMDAEEIRNYATALQKEDAYDLYLEVEGPDKQYYILGKASSDKSIALVSQEERCYIVDITGKVNYMQLPGIMNSLSERDSTTMDGYSILFDQISQDANREERRRQRKKEREEANAKKEAEQELQKDSTLLD